MGGAIGNGEAGASDEAAVPKRKETVHVVRGQLHKFMLIPILEDEIQWFPAGPVTFGVEARALADSAGKVGERGASIHVFDNDRKTERLRFDCFERTPHYHYIIQRDQHNIVWGYDPTVNGPMSAWALNAIRARLPALLRGAEAHELAERVEREGFDLDVLERIAAALVAAHERTIPGSELALKGRDWMNRWKELHPQFNTVD
jgi:hypothetical protein